MNASSHLGWEYCIATIALILGCTPSEAPRSELADPSPSKVALPTVTESPEEIRAMMKRYEPFSPEFDEARFKLVVALDAIRRREGVEGFHQAPEIVGGTETAMLDPKTGKIAWRALACYNPDCPGKGRGGGPFLFVREFENFRIDNATGKLIGGMPTTEELNTVLLCPVCNHADFIRPYDPPETIVRRRELQKELDDVRRARANAADTPMPSGRTPVEIMQEINEMPKLFLVPEEGKIAKLHGLTTPTSRGISSK